MAIHSSILAWRNPWTEEPGGLQSAESQRVRQDCSDLAHTGCICFHATCYCKELDATERLNNNKTKQDNIETRNDIDHSVCFMSVGCHITMILDHPYMLFMWPGTEASSHQPRECTTLEADSPAPGKPSDDSSPCKGLDDNHIRDH